MLYGYRHPAMLYLGQLCPPEAQLLVPWAAVLLCDISKLLNPEQQKRFQDIQSRWDAHHKNWK